MKYSYPEEYYVPDTPHEDVVNEMEMRMSFSVADLIAFHESGVMREYLDMLALASPETLSTLRNVLEDMDMQKWLGTTN